MTQETTTMISTIMTTGDTGSEEINTIIGLLARLPFSEEEPIDIHDYCFKYLNDLLISSNTVEEHLSHLEEVFQARLEP